MQVTKSDSGCRGPWLGRYISHHCCVTEGPHIYQLTTVHVVYSIVSVCQSCEQGFPWCLGPGFLMRLGIRCALGLQCELRLDCGWGTLLPRSLSWLASLGPSPRGPLHTAAA